MSEISEAPERMWKVEVYLPEDLALEWRERYFFAVCEAADKIEAEYDSEVGNRNWDSFVATGTEVFDD